MLKLSDFGIVADRGFLPKEDPAKALPPGWEFLDNFGRILPKILPIGTIDIISKTLPTPPLEALSQLSEAEKNRAMMIYGFGASAYVHSTYPSPLRKVLPSNLAQPLIWLSSHFGKPPILSYCSYSLNNWQRIDPSKDVELDNITLLQNFIDLYDENWFILIHVDIERKAAEAIENICYAVLEAHLGNRLTLLSNLENIDASLGQMIKTLRRMPEQCSTDVYYQNVRPWIMYFENVVYEGVSPEPQSYRGETGAQSSIMPLMEAGLGIQHAESVLTQHLQTMRLYMPPNHRRLIEEIEKTSKVREFIIQSGAPWLKDVYNSCLEKIFEFRDIHFGYAHSYIHQKTKDTKGTGGTPFMTWLEQMRNETEQMLLK